jgi:anti-sigma B factor antagonist
MKLTKTQEGSKLTVAVSGNLDTQTAPELQGELKTALTGITSLILDFTDLDYISSAGLRVVRGASKVMNRQGDMLVRGCNPEVKEVFEITGFADVINVE